MIVQLPKVWQGSGGALSDTSRDLDVRSSAFVER